MGHNFRIDKRGVDMSDAPDQRLLEVLLDSWDRNNTILLNLLRALPEGALEARAMEGSPSIAELFTQFFERCARSNVVSQGMAITFIKVKVANMANPKRSRRYE